jgi:hypothetical protein
LRDQLAQAHARIRGLKADADKVAALRQQIETLKRQLAQARGAAKAAAKPESEQVAKLNAKVKDLRNPDSHGLKRAGEFYALGK